MSTLAKTSFPRLSKAELHQLILSYQEDQQPRVAEEILTQIEPLIVSRVRRVLRGRTEYDDLYQVARMAAFRAISRWRADGGAAFTTYATRTMDGSLKRYFRDQMWDVHVTRAAKNRSLRVSTFKRHFEADHGREATLPELADFSGMSMDEVEEGEMATNGYCSESLDVPVTEGGVELGAILPDETTGPDRDLLMDVYREIRDLSDRERRIMFLSYYHDLTQREIAKQVGCSQMHVSRLLRRSLNKVRARIEEPHGEAQVS
ncbi:MAG: sigma-70 family RNA polymerase sigma factor [Euzebya sp.]